MLVRPLISPLISPGIKPINENFNKVTLVSSSFLHPSFTFSRASSKVYTDTNGALQTVGSNIPAFDYRGLSLHEQRINLAFNSEQFDAAYWVKTNSSVVANDRVAPDGVSTADKITLATAGGEAAAAVNGLSIGVLHCASVFLRAGTSDKIRLRMQGAVANADCDLTAVTVVGSGSMTSVGLESFGGGWYRLFGTFVATATGDTFTIRGNGASAGTFHVWGASLDTGAFPTPYISTAAAQVTRLVDDTSVSLSALGVDLSSGFTLLGAVVMERGPPSGYSPTIAQIDTGSSDTSAMHIRSDAGSTNFRVYGAAGSDVLPAYSPNVVYPFAATFNTATGRVAMSGAGGTVSASTGGLTTGLTTLRLGRRLTGACSLNGYIPKLALIRGIIPDAGLPAASMNA